MIYGYARVSTDGQSVDAQVRLRASGLSLITAAIVHWNTVYLHRAVQHARALGATIPDDLLAAGGARGP